MITDPWFYVVAFPAVILVGISKGGFGAGVAVLSVPLLALTIPATQAAAIMLPILCLMDILGTWAYRRTWDRVNMRIIVPGALVGIALGTATFQWFNDASIRLLVGTIAIAFSLNYWLRRGETRAPTGPNLAKGGFWSAVAGFTSFVAHAGGPPLGMYLLPQRLDKTVFVGTTVIFFILINYVKIVSYWWLGQLPVGNLATALVLCPAAPIGIGLGLWLHKRTPATYFYRVCYAFLLVTGLKLLYDGVGFFV